MICFPLVGFTPEGLQCESNEILITGGSFVGLGDVKCHVYNTDFQKVNLKKELSQKFSDI